MDTGKRLMLCFLMGACCMMLTGCHNEREESSSLQESVPYEFTGEKTLIVEPFAEPNYSSIVTSADSSLVYEAVYDQTQGESVQSTELSIFDARHELLATVPIQIIVRSYEDPIIHTEFPEQAIAADRFDLSDFVEASSKFNQNLDAVKLEWISVQDLLSQKAGYAVFDSKSGKAISPDHSFAKGEHTLYIIAAYYRCRWIWSCLRKFGDRAEPWRT